MFDSLDRIVCGLSTFVAGLDARSLDAEGAIGLVEASGRIERLAGALRVLAAGRVTELKAHQELGFRTAAEFVASATQSTLGAAIATTETASALTALPKVREALVAGELSSIQAAEVSSAALADPAAENSLVRAALSEPVGVLRERCRMVRAAAASDEMSCEKIRKGRYLRHWKERDGAIRMDARMAPDDVGPLITWMEKEASARQREAHRRGRNQSLEAHRADALCALFRGSALTKTVVHVRVDTAALERGRLAAGEVCEIEGIGPIPVSSANRILNDATLKLIEKRGVDVARVTTFHRAPSAAVAAAVWERDEGRCVVCGSRRDLEFDHIFGYHVTHRTRADELVLVCRFDHSKKTHHGYRLEGTHGGWRLVRGPGKARPP